MVTQIEHDVLVAWDASWAFRFRDKAKARVLAFQLNDAQVGVYDWVIDKYFHPSQWHAKRFKELYPEITEEKQIAKVTNGIDFDRYTKPTFEPRKWNRIVYSSSPDRGLHHLLRLWPKVTAKVPEAELHVFYDLDKWLELDAVLGAASPTHDRADVVRAAVTNPPPNVTFRGGVGQGQLSAEHVQSAILAYPCDPVAPTEGFSMTVLEGIVAGCEVIISDADAFPELWQNAPGVTMLPLPVDDDLWASVLADKMSNGNEERELRVRPNMSWKSIARRWVTELKLCLAPTTS
jgi:glycosyltransferase involved in cell wall biosynthesis